MIMKLFLTRIFCDKRSPEAQFGRAHLNLRRQGRSGGRRSARCALRALARHTFRDQNCELIAFY